MFLGGFIITPLGLILWGVCAAKGVSWGALVVGMALLGFTITIGGGIPIREDGVVIGAVGASGGSVDQDVIVARAALAGLSDQD